MKLTRVFGNTWVAEGMEMIPFYALEDGRCILLDTGLLEERDELEQALRAGGFTPAGILNSHAHVDHCGNNRYFQEKYRIPVAMTPGEAGMCRSLLNLKCYLLLLSPRMVEQEIAHLAHTPDLLLPEEDGQVEVAGVPFTILHTPGHSPQHICILTPDNVCYVGDALLSLDRMDAKLPYALDHRLALESTRKLLSLRCPAYILAHRDVVTDSLAPLAEANEALIRRRAREIWSLVDAPMSASLIAARVCAYYQLFTKKPRRALRFERNIRFFLEYLVDLGALELTVHAGAPRFSQAPGWRWDPPSAG